MDIDKYIQELKDTITAADRNYQVWWVLKGRETREKFTPIMNRYAPYFNAAIDAHFVALLEALYRLFETRQDTFNIPGLLKILNKFDQKLQDAKPLWKKVCILRNKAFSHRYKDMSVEEIFKQADMTPQELFDLISRSKELLEDISYELDSNGRTVNVNSGEFALLLLEELEEYHRILREEL